MSLSSDLEQFHTVHHISTPCSQTYFQPPENSDFFFSFNWRIIALQCCVSFCSTTKSIVCVYTSIPSLLSLPPTTLFPPFSRTTQGTGLSSMHDIQWLPSSYPEISSLSHDSALTLALSPVPPNSHIAFYFFALINISCDI